MELFAAVGTLLPAVSEREFDAMCATIATMASYSAFNETIASWLQQQGVPTSRARSYIANLFLGVATTAAEASDHSFESLAAAHATPGWWNIVS